MKEKIGSFFVCATPIGNLSDVSLRLLDILKQVDLIAAEDTRVTLKLLNRFEIKTKCVRLDKYTESSKSDYILALLQSGKSIAYVSDAGTPGICDPGANIVNFLSQHSINIVPIVGCSAVTSLISCSGILLDSYTFCGFVPRKRGEFTHCLELLSNNATVGVFYESPSRILKTFIYLEQLYPKINCVVAKELTKVHERFFRGSVKQVCEMLHTFNLKGEWLFMLDFSCKLQKEPTLNKTFISLCKNMKLSNQDIVKLAVSVGMKKNQVYDFLH